MVNIHQVSSLSRPRMISSRARRFGPSVKVVSEVIMTWLCEDLCFFIYSCRSSDNGFIMNVDRNVLWHGSCFYLCSLSRGVLDFSHIFLIGFPYLGPSIISIMPYGSSYIQ